MEQQYLNEIHMRNSQACLRDQRSCAQRPLSVEDVLAQSRRLGRSMIRKTSSAKVAYKSTTELRASHHLTTLKSNP